MPGATPRVMLSWARDRRGERVHVRELDPRRRDDRAPFTCPGCAEPLVPHLGRVRTRHFAHRPGSTCPLTAPETVLHLDAKERLAWLFEEALGGRRTVVLALSCPACRRPAPSEVPSFGDGVLREGQVGSRRADVLLTRGGAPAVAIEVRVAHAVDPGKERDLGALGVPVAEIDAHATWEEEREDGTRVLCARSLGFPPCPACASATRADADRRLGGEDAEVAELESYRARGLLGSPPGPVAPGEVSLTVEDQERLGSAFRCPDCGETSLHLGRRLARHACPGSPPRAVAWRGYDGKLVSLGWWRTGGGGA